jgi:hypothetical protein
VIDPSETAVLPENELTNRRKTSQSAERDHALDKPFDETLVLEDELERRRRRRVSRSFAP